MSLDHSIYSIQGQATHLIRLNGGLEEGSAKLEGKTNTGLMNSFNKTEAAIFPMQAMLHRTFPFPSYKCKLSGICISEPFLK